MELDVISQPMALKSFIGFFFLIWKDDLVIFEQGDGLNVLE